MIFAVIDNERQVTTTGNANSQRIRFFVMIFMLVGLLGGLIATAQSSNSIQIAISLNPAQIAVKGTGTPDTTTVSVTLTGPAMNGNPADIVLLLDRSKSVDLAAVKAVAREIIAHLNPSDNLAIVSFADTARVDQELTADRVALDDAIEGLTQGTETAMGDGMMLAIDEIARGKRANASPVIIMPTDGVNNVGQDPLPQATRAVEQAVPIFPIGMSPVARGLVLSEIASVTQAVYFASYSDSALERIFRSFNRAAAASNIRLRLTLPSGLSYEGGLLNPPAQNAGREVTQIDWVIYLLFEGGSWQSQFQLSGSREGTMQILQAPSELQYFNGASQLVIVDLTTSDFAFTALQIGQGTGAPPPPPPTTTPPTTQPPDDDQDEDDQTASTQPGGNAAPTPSLAFADGSPEVFVVGEAVTFSAAASTATDGQITTLEWDWTNDGTIDLTTNDVNTLVRHPYAKAGEFTARLVVADNAGATAEATLTVMVMDGLRPGAAHTSDFANNPTIPEWMAYYIDDGVVTDEETRDANARFAADVFIPGTQYRLTTDDVQAIIQLNEVAKLVEDYGDVAAAETAGYVQVGSFVPGVGLHYVNEAYLSGPTLHDQPPVLLYDVEPGGELRLAGVRYISTNQDEALFQITAWANHPASAHYADGTEQAAASLDNVPLENTSQSPLLFWHPTLYGLTVWLTMLNPDGLFASRNGQVSQ